MTGSDRKPESPPAVSKRPEWADLDLPFNIGSGRTLHSGQEQNGRVRMRFFKRKSDGRVIGVAWFGQGADGPPGHVHGGAVAYALDEAMGAAAWSQGYPAVAAELNFQYERMAPMHQDLLIEAWVEAAQGKRLDVRANLTLQDGTVCVRGRGSFAVLSKAKGEALLKTLPDYPGKWSKLALKWSDVDSN